jgi:hypothetical protein
MASSVMVFQPPSRRSSHVRYTAAAPDVRQLSCGTCSSKRAGRVTESKAQVTHGLTGTADRGRTEQVAERHRERTIAEGEISACGQRSVRSRSGRRDQESCFGLRYRRVDADSSKQSEQLGFQPLASRSTGSLRECRFLDNQCSWPSKNRCCDLRVRPRNGQKIRLFWTTTSIFWTAIYGFVLWDRNQSV